MGDAVNGRPQKHSLTLKGHRTSVSLEAEFWAVFREIAEAEGKPVNTLASEIDTARAAGVGLASAIRVFILMRLKSRYPEITERQR